PLGHIDVPFEAMEKLSGELSGAKATTPVIVGTIDDGLPFANERFRVNNASTRVEYLWDQDRTSDLAKATIDSYLSACQRAGLVAKKCGTGPLPIVVNLSYGINHGPHDGTSLLEEAIDALTLLRRTENAFTMVLAAGNSHLTRCHAHFELKPGTSQSQTLD